MEMPVACHTATADRESRLKKWRVRGELGSEKWVSRALLQRQSFWLLACGKKAVAGVPVQSTGGEKPQLEPSTPVGGGAIR
jgi:hypothetical protein